MGHGDENDVEMKDDPGIELRETVEAPTFSEGARAQVAEIAKPLYGIPKSDEKLVGVRVVEGGFVEPAPSRQVRRAEERATSKQSVALTKMAENAERVVVGEEQASKLQKMRQMLFALVRREGRVRLTQRELAAVQSRDGLDVKVQENGDLAVTYLPASQRG